MSSGKKKRQPIQQAPAPTYGAQESTQSFTPWGPAQVGYDAIASQMGAQAGIGPQWVSPSAETNAALGSMGALGQTAIKNFNFLSNAADVANNPQVQAMAKANEQQVASRASECRCRRGRAREFPPGAGPGAGTGRHIPEPRQHKRPDDVGRLRPGLERTAAGFREPGKSPAEPFDAWAGPGEL